MTKFAEPSFSVAAALTKEYADGYARTFPASLPEKSCTECLGEGKLDVSFECVACNGTGLRSWQSAT